MNLPRTELSVFSDLQDRGNHRRGDRLDEESVRELAAYRGHPAVVSLYVDIDGAHRPALSQCDTALEGLFRTARRQALSAGEEVALTTEADLAAIEEWITAGVDRATTRGLALFSCTGQAFLQVFTLPVPVRDQVSVEAHPNVGQLEEILDRTQPLMVVLVDSQQARLLDAHFRATTEIINVVDPIERQVDTDVELGSWEHRHEEALRQHLRRVAAAVTNSLQTRRIHALVVSGPTRSVEALIDLLPPLAADRIVARLAVPVDAGGAELDRAIGDVQTRLESERKARLVADLRARIATGEGAAGLDASLAALDEKRVHTLVVGIGYSAAGAKCTACGHLGVGARDCPWCAKPTEVTPNVIDDAVEAALAQHADVEFVPADQIADLGCVAAVERHR